MDAALPAHLVAFASRLRELRRECGQPTYRVMTELAHCSLASLSGAAAGRRLPTWETTRGYVTACLRHAGRTAELDSALRQWRHAWEDASVRDKAHHLAPVVVAAPPARPAHRHLRRPAAVLVVLALLATMAGAAARPTAPAPMAGLLNVLVVPSTLPALENTLGRDLEQWARDEPVVAVRGPAGVDPGPLETLAVTHNADIVLSGRIRPAGDRWTVTIDVLLTERVFSETPEFVGRHEISLTEPADVIRGNVEVNRQLAGDAVRYVQAVVAFVRGLGRYALDDYPGAERDFRTADRGLSSITDTVRAEVILLMLGNAVGRTGRFAEAAAIYRRALAQRPGYERATVGLAEAVRAGAGCTARSGPSLREALADYQAVPVEPGNPLLEMKRRLGLGLAYQCLSIAGTPSWAQADGQFRAVLRTPSPPGALPSPGALSPGASSSGASPPGGSSSPGASEAGRQALRLRAEARAGLALTAWLAGRYAEAAAGYEEALGLLSRVTVDRPTLRERELLFLKNLREVYAAMKDTASAEEVAARIRRAGGTP
jgi:tetratricopeptide (TPR) repeat protein